MYSIESHPSLSLSLSVCVVVGRPTNFRSEEFATNKQTINQESDSRQRFEWVRYIVIGSVQSGDATHEDEI